MNKLLKKIDSIDFSGKKFKAFIFIIVALVMFTFFYVRSRTSFDATSKMIKNSSVIKLENGVEVKQQLPMKNQKLQGLQLQFDTYGKENKGTLHIKIYEDDSVIKEWEFEAGRLPGLEYNEGYYSFGLDELYSTDASKEYYFTVSEDYQGDNAVGICTSSDGTICYKVMKTDTSLRMKVLIIAFIIFAAIIAMVILNVDERIIMVTLLVSFGLIYFWLCPVGMAPDETNHFYRAYEISQGGLISKHMGESGVGGNTFPAALKEYKDSKAELNWDETLDYKFGNTSLYSAISYLPQATGIKIADIFTNNVKAIFYGGRLGNFIVSMFLCIMALWIIPFGRKVLFMVMMFPLTMQEMISMSTDGFTIGLSFMLLAYILYVSYREKDLGKKEIAILTALCIMLSLTKIIYVVLVLLVFMVPNKKLGEGRKWAIFKFGVPALCVILNLVWLVISSGYLVEFRPGVDSAAQVKYILTHIHLYYATAVSTTMETGMYYVETMFGTYMGQLEIAIVPMVWVTFLILFVYEIVDSRDVPVKAHRYDMFILLSVFLTCMALLYTSLYVQWTPLQNPSIEGIQGRYFIPIIPLLALACMYGINIREVRAGNVSRYSKKASYYFVFLALLNGITVLDMILYYLCE